MHYIERKIELDAGHRIPTHGSKCRNIHGHRYVVVAVLSGDIVENGTESGMVADFGFVKDLLMTVVHDPCDHRLLLWHDDPILSALEVLENAFPHLNENGLAITIVPCIPTAENLAEYWFNRLDFEIKASHKPCKLIEVRVHETPNAVAVYRRPVSITTPLLEAEALAR